MTLVDVKTLYTTRPPTNPSSSIQGWGLISWPLSPAAICSSSSSTETCYLTLCGRLAMELFIRQSLSCLLCAGFIIASAMFGRQYLCLVSCAATCLLFQRRCAQALAIYHPLRGFLIKSPTSPSAPGRYRLQEMWKMSENLTAALCPLCHYPWAGYTLWRRRRFSWAKTTTHLPFLSDEVIEPQSPTPRLLKPPKAKLQLMSSHTIKAQSFVCDSIIWLVCFGRFYVCHVKE